MQLEIHGAIERAILSRFRSGNFESIEDVLVDAFAADDDVEIDQQMTSDQKQALIGFLDHMHSRTEQPVIREFDGRDHDRILYGDQNP